MADAIKLLGSFVLGGIGWMVFAFLAQPFRRFFDLKFEVSRQLHVFGNVRTDMKEFGDPNGMTVAVRANPGEVLSNTDSARLNRAIETFRDLAAQMKGAADADWFASRALFTIGYDLNSASKALTGLSNCIGTYGQQRADAFDRVCETLKIKRFAGEA